MKSKFLLTFFFASSLTLAMQAQIVDPNRVAQNDATNRANNNIDNGIDNAESKTENGIKSIFKKKNKTNSNASSSSTTTTTTPNATNSGAAPSFKTYSNYDFVPGDTVVFEDHFTDDQDGEFPSHWQLLSGQAILNTVGGQEALLITDGNYGRVTPLIKSNAYLSDNFTIEFDYYSTGGYAPHLYFYNNAADAIANSNDVAELSVGAGNGWGGMEVAVPSANIDLTGSYPAEIKEENYFNKWHHVAMVFKNNQLKVYTDQYRVVVVPNMGISPRAFAIAGIGDEKQPMILSNFRIADGGNMNMLHKKFTDTKIITHGINFDIDKATIKPESMGTLNMIVSILKENLDIKFEIDGHTDNTGDAKHNLTLSQQRADAVKAQLIAMGIDAARLTTKGFGDSKPVADNNTLEGKANNRRVEFIKQ